MGSSLSRVAMPGAEVGLRGGFSQGPVGLGKAERSRAVTGTVPPYPLIALVPLFPLAWLVTPLWA